MAGVPGIKVVELSDGNSVNIVLENDDGLHTFYDAMRDEQVGDFLDMLRKGKPIAYIQDYESEKRDDWLKWAFTGTDSTKDGWGIRKQGEDPAMAKARYEIYSRLTPNAKDRFLQNMNAPYKQTILTRGQKNLEVAQIGKKAQLPMDAVKNIAQFVRGKGRRKTRGKSKKRRQTKRR